MRTRIVAFLQNQWFKNPERHKAFAAKHPELREDLIARFLFAGCKTGRVLRAALGDALCDEIIWEETSREIGGYSGAIFPPDHEHINAVCLKHNPDVILAFGKQATEALRQRDGIEDLFCGPHPANRRNDTHQLLFEMRRQIDHYEAAYARGERGNGLFLTRQ